MKCDDFRTANTRPDANTVAERSADTSSAARDAAFTLLEVMIAAGIFFICLFAILAVVSNCLRNARALQRQTVDIGSVAGQIYYQLSSTNKVSAGPVDLDLRDTFPEYTCAAEVFEVASNGLCQVDISMRRHGSQEDAKLSMFMYLPQFQEGGFGKGFRQ
jgi:Tfp pilus assembly protein PilV